MVMHRVIGTDVSLVRYWTFLSNKDYDTQVDHQRVPAQLCPEFERTTEGARVLIETMLLLNRVPQLEVSS